MTATLIVVPLAILATLLICAFLDTLDKRIELAEQAKVRAFIRAQERRANEQIETITRAALSAMLQETRNQDLPPGDPPCRG